LPGGGPVVRAIGPKHPRPQRHDGRAHLRLCRVLAYVLLSNRASWKRLDPSMRDFLTGQIEKLGGRLWDLAEKETKEGIACLTGGSCSDGPAAKMTLVPTRIGDLALVRKSFMETVSPRWAERCGTDCVANWNATVGRIFGLSLAAAN
jgi:hypothetical protein